MSKSVNGVVPPMLINYGQDRSEVDMTEIPFYGGLEMELKSNFVRFECGGDLDLYDAMAKRILMDWMMLVYLERRNKDPNAWDLLKGKLGE